MSTQHFLDTLPLPILNENEKQLYERELTETELNAAVMSMAPKTHLETMNQPINYIVVFGKN